MNLIWFLTIGIGIALITGELGRYPFGGGGVSVTLYDLVLGITLLFLTIWKVGITKDLKSFFSLRPMIPFLSIALISLLLSGNFSGVFYLVRFIFYVLTIWLGFSLESSKVVTTDRILQLIAGIGVIFSGLGFVQLLVYPDLNNLIVYGFDPHNDRLVSTLLDPNLLAGILNVSLAASFYLWQKNRSRLLSIVCIVIFVAIFLTFSRSGYLFLLVQILLWGITKFRKWLAIGLLMGILLFLLYPRFNERIMSLANPDTSALARISSWENGIIIFRQSPILGVGFNNIRSELVQNNLQKVYSSDGGHAGGGVDASLIFVVATTGVIGLLAYLYFWFEVLRLKLKDPLLRKTFLFMSAGLFVHSLFVNSLFYPPVLFVLFLWVGSTISNRESL